MKRGTYSFREKLHPTQERLFNLLRDSSPEPLTTRELASELGLASPNTVSHHIRQLEKKGYLQRDSSTGIIKTITDPVNDITFVNIYGMARCGPDGFFAEDRVVDRVPLPARTFRVTNDSFLVEAQGDSMYPDIKEGDLVLAEKGIEPENGNIVVVIHNDSAKIKKFFAEKGRVIFQSVNPAYPPLGAYSDDEFSICGVVTGVVQKFQQQNALAH